MKNRYVIKTGQLSYHQEPLTSQMWTNLIKIRSFDPLALIATKGHTKVKSGDLSIMHDNNVMPMRKLSPDWLNTHVTEEGFR